MATCTYCTVSVWLMTNYLRGIFWVMNVRLIMTFWWITQSGIWNHGGHVYIQRLSITYPFFPAFKWNEFRNRILISPDRKMTTYDEHIGHNHGCFHKLYNTDTVDGPAKSCTTKRMVETCWNPMNTGIWILVQPMRASSVSSLVRYQCYSLYCGWAGEIRITSW